MIKNPSEHLTEDVTVDAKGLNCPLPILRTGKAILTLPADKIVKILTTDPDSCHDFPVFCKQSGHVFLEYYTEKENGEDVFSFWIKTKGKE